MNRSPRRRTGRRLSPPSSCASGLSGSRPRARMRGSISCSGPSASRSRRAGTLDFERFPFQRELYERGADDRELVIKKATQVGVSAFCVRWAIYWAEQAGLTALYVFPYQRQLADFSAARIRPLLGAEFLSDRVADGGVRNAGADADRTRAPLPAGLRERRRSAIGGRRCRWFSTSTTCLLPPISQTPSGVLVPLSTASSGGLGSQLAWVRDRGAIRTLGPPQLARALQLLQRVAAGELRGEHRSRAPASGLPAMPSRA